MRRCRAMWFSWVLFLLNTPALAADPVPGVSDDRILFGQTAAFDGPAKALGTEMRTGIEAAFAEANQEGGVQGRRLELVSYDDSYEPEIAVRNTLRLIEEDGVFALIGPVGTPTSLASVPISEEAGVPVIAPFTGAQFLRSDELTTVINLRASYFQETEEIVHWLTVHQGLERIAVLYQDDSYGRAGLAGVRVAMARRNMTPVSEGAYKRNTTAVKRALLAIRRGDPQAVIIIGAYAPSAIFIKWARKLGIDALLVNVSFVGTNALIEALGPDGVGTYISQVVPPPDSTSLPILAQYRAAMAAADAESKIGFVSLEGYLAGRLTIAVLRAMTEPPTREGFLETLAALGDFDLGGFKLSFGKEDNQGSDAVFLTMIDVGGRIVAVESSRE